jgi:type I restriction enzyme M protein
MNQQFDHIASLLADYLTRSGKGADRMNVAGLIEQFGHLVLLKVLDEEEAAHQARRNQQTDVSNSLLFPAQSVRYRWRNWATKTDADLQTFLRDEVFPYMASLSKEDSIVAEYFRDASFEIDSPSLLKKIVKEIDGLHLTSMSPHVKGALFEQLLTSLGANYLNGLFSTPRHIRQLMVQLVDPGLDELVFDPACGTGGFLADVVTHIVAKHSDHVEEALVSWENWFKQSGKTLEELKRKHPLLQTYLLGDGAKIKNWAQLDAAIFGTDVSRQMVRISTVNLLLRNIRRPTLKRANSLSDREGLSDIDRARKYDVILCNPPFGGLVARDSIRPELAIQSKRSELLFLSLLMEHLAPGGRCAAIVPKSILGAFSTAHVAMRTRLLQDFDLLAVISLPRDLMEPVMSMETAVLVFRRPLSDAGERPNKTWYYNLFLDGYLAEDGSKNGRVERPDLNEIPYLLDAWRAFKASGFKKPSGRRAGSAAAADEANWSGWWVSHAELRKAGFNFSPERWEPQTETQTVSEQTPEGLRELLSEVVADYELLLEGIETLKRELDL